MKRYWKLMVLVVIILATIGTYYTHNYLTADKGKPHFSLKTVKGEKQMAKNLSLELNYQPKEEETEGDWSNYDISVTTKGSSMEKPSFLNRLTEDYSSPEIKRLQQKHRNFMRGKTGDKSQFAENKKMLVYADADDGLFDRVDKPATMKVSWLNKESKHQSTFKIQLPEHHKTSDFFIDRVLLVNGQIKVITQNYDYGADSDMENRFHVYTVDPKAKKIVQDDVIASNSDEANDTMDTLTDQSNDTSSTIIIEQQTPDDQEDADEQEAADDQENTDEQWKKLIAYDIKKEEKIKLDLPNELKGMEVVALEGHTLYFGKQHKKNYTTVAYDMMKQKITKRQKIKQPKLFANPNLTTSVQDGKLYMIPGDTIKQDDTVALIVDVKTGKTLYEGKLDVQSEDKDYSIYANGYTLTH